MIHLKENIVVVKNDQPTRPARDNGLLFSVVVDRLCPTVKNNTFIHFQFLYTYVVRTYILDYDIIDGRTVFSKNESD